MTTTGKLTVESTLFGDGETIPMLCAHTYVGGDNVSPDLTWSSAPDGTAVFAITCYDPDAPTTVGFVHWVLFNIPARISHLDAGAGAKGKNPTGSTLGFTDWGESQYGGMAPPAEDPPHHYHFTAWALDQRVDSDETTTYAKFNFLTRGHVLAKGELVGMFGL